MKIYNSKKIIFYILIIFLSLVIVGLIGAIIRLINIPSIIITIILIGGLVYYNKIGWLKNILSSRKKSFTPKSIFKEAENYLYKNYSENSEIKIPYNIIFVSGWIK